MNDPQPTGPHGTGPHGTGPQTTGPEASSPWWYTPHGYTPHGATAIADRPAHQDSPGATQQPRATGSGRRRTAELAAVAILAASLSAGGTVAAARLGDDPPPSPATPSAQPGRGPERGPVAQADPSSPDWTATAAAVAPSVVAISAESGQGTAAGSGVVIDGSGHVVTNNHVVAGADTLQVTLSDGRAYAATVRGTDPSTDLAVITIEDAPADLAPIAMGDSDALEVGDPVMAVGNPLGLAGTVTTGIVSALNRPVTTRAEPQQSPFAPGSLQSSEPVVTNAIQTSAAINPGNSGGALVDARGRLVGINSAIASLGASGGQAGSIGIGFAIPVTEVRSIARQLIDTGTAKHAYLGVTPRNGTASDGSATRAGAEVASVGEGTPAAAAGLRVGDVIVAVDGAPVDSAESLVGYIRGRAVGATVTLTVLRDGARTAVKATLAERSASG